MQNKNKYKSSIRKSPFPLLEVGYCFFLTTSSHKLLVRFSYVLIGSHVFFMMLTNNVIY